MNKIKVKNYINTIQDWYGISKEGYEVPLTFVDFYYTLIGEALSTSKIAHSSFKIGPFITSQSNDLLVTPITNYKIKDALFSVHSDKSVQMGIPLIVFKSF